MFRYAVPSDPQYIPGVVHVVSLLAMEFGFGVADYAMNLPLAHRRGGQQRHHPRQPPRRPQARRSRGQIDAGTLRVKVRDEGEGFRARSDVTIRVDPENLLASSGRGLFLIESVMDEVRPRRMGAASRWSSALARRRRRRRRRGAAVRPGE